MTDQTPATEAGLPDRVIVDQHGHYWRDYGMWLSMCPVSDENTRTETAAVYVRAVRTASRDGSGPARYIATDPQTPATEAGRRLVEWAGSVDRLIAVAPIKAVINETGIPWRSHSTPPERQAIRAEAHATVARWLARDLANLEPSDD